MHKQIELWKHQYGRVFKLNLEGKEVYFRPLTCSEIIYLKDKEDRQFEIIPHLVILNDVMIKLPGSFSKLSTHVIKESSVPDTDTFELKILQSKARVKDDFMLSMVAKICATYPYKPDELLGKTLDQLFDIYAMAGQTNGTDIMTGKPMTMPQSRESSKFEAPNTDVLMDESTDALSVEMAKHGKIVPKLGEQENSKLTDLEKQMKQLSNI